VDPIEGFETASDQQSTLSPHIVQLAGAAARSRYKKYLIFLETTPKRRMTTDSPFWPKNLVVGLTVLIGVVFKVERDQSEKRKYFSNGEKH
jgi:hypothetical protein